VCKSSSIISDSSIFPCILSTIFLTNYAGMLACMRVKDWILLLLDNYPLSCCAMVFILPIFILSSILFLSLYRYEFFSYITLWISLPRLYDKRPQTVM
jgi:hypothetical protein